MAWVPSLASAFDLFSCLSRSSATRMTASSDVILSHTIGQSVLFSSLNLFLLIVDLHPSVPRMIMRISSPSGLIKSRSLISGCPETHGVRLLGMQSDSLGSAGVMYPFIALRSATLASCPFFIHVGDPLMIFSRRQLAFRLPKISGVAEVTIQAIAGPPVLNQM